MYQLIYAKRKYFYGQWVGWTTHQYTYGDLKSVQKSYLDRRTKGVKCFMSTPTITNTLFTPLSERVFSDGQIVGCKDELVRLNLHDVLNELGTDFL